MIQFCSFQYAEHGVNLGGESPLWGVDRSRQPLAEVQGVHRKVESEGIRRQIFGPRNMNHIRQTILGQEC